MNAYGHASLLFSSSAQFGACLRLFLMYACFGLLLPERDDDEAVREHDGQERVESDLDQRRLVWGSRYSGRNRLLRRMALGIVRSLEVEDTSPTSTALLILQRWMEKVVEKEVARMSAKCQRYQERQSYVPR
jgi:hypothetical protein